MLDKYVNLIQLQIPGLIRGDIFRVDFKPEVRTDLNLDNIFFDNVMKIKAEKIKTDKNADNGMKFLKMCFRTENPEIVDSNCTLSKSLYTDNKNLISLGTSITFMKNNTSIYEQPHSLFIKNLNSNCTIAQVYKTFLVRDRKSVV